MFVSSPLKMGITYILFLALLTQKICFRKIPPQNAIFKTLGHPNSNAFKINRSLAEFFHSMPPHPITQYKDTSINDLHEYIQQIRKVSESIHKSWIDALLDSQEETHDSIEIPISMYLQVSLGVIYTPSNPNGYTVFMDTGSSHAVLPLSNRVTRLSGTFKGIRTDNFVLYNNSIYYGALAECPVIFKPELYCTSASYVSDASNSVVGVEELRTDLNDNASILVTTEYKLNLLRGANFGEVGIFGIGFGLRGFKTTPFLTPFYSQAGPQTILFQLKTNNKPFDSNYSMWKQVGTIKINTDFLEGDYKWAYFDKRGKNYSLNVMYGVYISTSGGPGVFHMSEKELGDIKVNIKKETNTELKYNSFMFDSGTCGFILDVENTTRIISGLKRIYDHMLLIERSGNSVFVCWPSHQLALEKGFISPAKVYINIFLENIRAAVSIDGMAFNEISSSEGVHQCIYILVMDRARVQIVGYPIWKKLDLIWDANGGRVGIRNGITNK